MDIIRPSSRGLGTDSNKDRRKSVSVSLSPARSRRSSIVEKYATASNHKHEVDLTPASAKRNTEFHTLFRSVPEEDNLIEGRKYID